MAGWTTYTEFGGRVVQEWVDDEIRMMLLTGTYVPNAATDTLPLANELPTANGYTAGGYLITAKVRTGDTFDCDDITITAAGGDLVFRTIVFYNVTSNYLIAFQHPNSATADYTVVDGTSQDIVVDSKGLGQVSGDTSTALGYNKIPTFNEIGFHGDSITAGLGATTDADRYVEQWFNNSLTNFTGFQINAVGGRTTGDGVAALSELDPFTNVSCWALLFGSNDSAAVTYDNVQSKENMRTMIAYVRDTLGKNVILLDVPPRGLNENRKITQYRVGWLDLAVEESIPFWPYWKSIIDLNAVEYPWQAAFTGDNIHGNDAGYAAMGAALVAAENDVFIL